MKNNTGQIVGFLIFRATGSEIPQISKEDGKTAEGARVPGTRRGSREPYAEQPRGCAQRGQIYPTFEMQTTSIIYLRSPLSRKLYSGATPGIQDHQ
jgi:hypothetical protein